MKTSAITSAPITSGVVGSSVPVDRSPRSIDREFRRLLDEGVPMRVAGTAKRNPRALLSRGYAPKHRIDLFDSSFYLSTVRQNQDIRFFVAYVLQPDARGRRAIYPRIFYKDLSLIWRSASHFVRSENENWVGKGELRTYVEGGVQMECSVESTTDLPLEVQSAMEDVCRLARRILTDEVALGLVLRRGGDDRLDAYRDFLEPRRRARANPRNLVNRGRPVARFTRQGDPSSLRFVKGFEPDFERGILEVSSSSSKMYGGKLGRYRILSRNRRIQYLFMAGPRQVWIIPPQATTTELSSYGVRTIDVHVDEDLCIPGYEYHYLDESEDPPVFVTQIPEGYAGKPSEVDAYRADASAWLDRMPVVREFRKKVLGRGPRRGV
ncbi:MAG: hypothetical protein QNK04_31560 [Myxococcota bacterium]|nr:hypothetical protein [Myxococcota bacterium]